jgi:hypothetical protein
MFSLGSALLNDKAGIVCRCSTFIAWGQQTLNPSSRKVKESRRAERQDCCGPTD